MNFPSLIEFLKIKRQYPFSRKRNFVNKLISLISYITISDKKEKYDVLFLLDSPKTNDRYNVIIETITKEGFSCLSIYFTSRQIDKFALKGALLSKDVISSDFATQKGFAMYLKNRFSPSIILQVDDCSFISKFIKEYSGAFLVNIAHCVSCNSENFDFFDYHYYFLFGKSSVENLKNIKNSYGKTKLVQIGSLFLQDSKLNNFNQDTSKNFILFSSQWLSPSVADDIIWSRSIINQLAERNPSLNIRVKPHPLESDLNWVNPLPNITIMDNKSNYHEFLKNVSYHITHHSAFALEASVCDVPTVCIQRKNFIETCLGFNKYFPIVDNIYELENVLKGDSMKNENVKAFREQHLVNIGNEINYFKSIICDIITNSEITVSQDLAGTFYD